MPRSVFVATLGSEPQVVTIALQLLLAEGVPIEAAHVIHTSGAEPSMAASLKTLRGAFAHPALRGVRLHLLPLMHDGFPLADITTEQEALSTFRATYAHVRALKQQRHQIRFSLTGGRKVMSVYALAVAQLLFDERDALYYLISDGSLRDERRLFLRPGDRAELIQVPFMRWSADAAVMAEVLRLDDPLEALARGTALTRRTALLRAETFCRHVLTPAEERVVALVVSEGLSNAQVARRLGRSPKTVANQLSSAYAKLAEYLGREGERGVDRHALTVALHAYYAALSAKNVDVGTNS